MIMSPCHGLYDTKHRYATLLRSHRFLNDMYYTIVLSLRSITYAHSFDFLDFLPFFCFNGTSSSSSTTCDCFFDCFLLLLLLTFSFSSSLAGLSSSLVNNDRATVF